MNQDISTLLKLSNAKPVKNDFERILWGTTELEGRAVGIDPGANFGMTIISNGKVMVAYGHLPKTKVPGKYGVEAYDYITREFAGGDFEGVPAVVEGAAFDKRFGQVGLAEIRFGFFFALYQCGLSVRIVAPKRIRRISFGDGKKGAWEIWPAINHNGADSIGAAIAALREHGGHHSQNDDAA